MQSGRVHDTGLTQAGSPMEPRWVQRAWRLKETMGLLLSIRKGSINLQLKYTLLKNLLLGLDGLICGIWTIYASVAYGAPKRTWWWEKKWDGRENFAFSWKTTGFLWLWVLSQNICISTRNFKFSCKTLAFPWEMLHFLAKYLHSTMPWKWIVCNK